MDKNEGNLRTNSPTKNECGVIESSSPRKSPLLIGLLNSEVEAKSLKRTQDAHEQDFPNAKVPKRSTFSIGKEIEPVSSKTASPDPTPQLLESSKKQDVRNEQNKQVLNTTNTKAHCSKNETNLTDSLDNSKKPPANLLDAQLDKNPNTCYDYCILCMQKAADRCPLILGCLHIFCSKCILNKQHFYISVTQQAKDSPFATTQEPIKDIIPDNAYVSLSSLKNHISTLSNNQKILVKCPICECNSRAKVIHESQFICTEATKSDPLLTEKKKINCTNCEERGIAIMYCTQCEEYLCEECVNAHKRVKLTKEHLLSLINEDNTKGSHVQVHMQHKFCDQHPSEKIKVYCVTCKLLTCRDCQLESHRTHKHLFIEEAASSQRETLRAINEKLNEKLNHLQICQTKVSQTLTEVDEKQNLVTDDIKLFHQKLIEIIQQKTNNFVERINELTAQRKLKLSSQLLATEKLILAVEHCRRFIDLSLKDENSIALMHSKSLILEYLSTIMRHKFYPGPVAASHLLFVQDKSTLHNLNSQLGSLHWGIPGMEIQQPPIRVNNHPQQPLQNGAINNMPNQQNFAAQKKQQAPPANRSRIPSTGLQQQPQQFINNFNNSTSTIHHNVKSGSQNHRIPPQPHNVKIPPQTSTLIELGSLHPHYNTILQGNSKTVSQTAYQIQKLQQLKQKQLQQQKQHQQLKQNQQHKQNQHLHSLTMQTLQLKQQQQQQILQQNKIRQLQQQQQQQQKLQQQFIRPPQVSPPVRPNVFRATTPTRYNTMPLSPTFINTPTKPTVSQQIDVNVTKELNPSMKPFVSRPKSNPSCSYQEQGNSFVTPNRKTSNPTVPTPSPPQSSFLGGVMALNQQVLPGLNAPLQSPLSERHSPSSASESNEQVKKGKTSQDINIENSDDGGKTDTSQNLSPPPLLDLTDFIKLECDNSPISFDMEAKDGCDSDKDIADIVNSLSEQQQQETKTIKKENDTAAPSDDGGKWNNFWAQYDETVTTNKDDPNDDWCAVCQNGGDLLCCDTCPKVFHLQCHVPEVLNTPPGTWQCTLCKNVDQALEEESKTLKRKRTIGLHGKELKECEKVLLELYCHRQSAPFHFPVKSSSVPNYYKVIKESMDLSKIKKKLLYTNFNHYDNVSDFFEDIYIMFANCYKFNGKNSVVFKMGKELELQSKTCISTYFPDYKFNQDKAEGSEENPKKNKADNEGDKAIEEFVKNSVVTRADDDLWKPGQTDDEEEDEEILGSDNDDENEEDGSESDSEMKQKRRKQNKSDIFHIH